MTATQTELAAARAAYAAEVSPETERRLNAALLAVLVERRSAEAARFGMTLEQYEAINQ